MRRIVTLLTDFGTVDGFAGAMKGVVLSRAPDAQVVDLTHEIVAHDIRGGAWTLREAARTFPPETIHVAVVDPGVGTERRPILIESRGRLFIGPDNGVLSLAAPDGEAWHLNRPEWHREAVSRTFHGRDIFASVAGHLAAGVAPSRCGAPITSWLCLVDPQPSQEGRTIHGEVVRVDRFGNLITNIGLEDLGEPEAGWEVKLGDRSLGAIRGTFGDVAPGQWVAYMGSSGFVEIAVREGKAAAVVEAGQRVRLCRS